MAAFLHSEAAWALTERLGTALAAAGYSSAQVKAMNMPALLAAAQASEADAAALTELGALEVTQGEPPLAYARALIYLHMAAYRPRGGARAGAGRPKGSGLGLNEAEQARYARWLAWWPTRPAPQRSAYALAKLLQEPESTVRSAANGTRPPSPSLLAALEDSSRSLGFTP